MALIGVSLLLIILLEALVVGGRTGACEHHYNTRLHPFIDAYLSGTYM